MGLQERMMMKKQGYKGELKVRERERLSQKPFGEHNTKGRFKFDVHKVPFYNVPDITGFKLKPYVPYNTPMIDDERRVRRLVTLDNSTLKNIEHLIEEASRGRLEKVDTNTEFKRK